MATVFFPKSNRTRTSDPSLIGTIASCPKCNSMVQIDRPTDQVAVGRSGVDSQAITEEAIDSDDDSAAVDPATGGSVTAIITLRADYLADGAD